MLLQTVYQAQDLQTCFSTSGRYLQYLQISENGCTDLKAFSLSRKWAAVELKDKIYIQINSDKDVAMCPGIDDDRQNYRFQLGNISNSCPEIANMTLCLNIVCYPIDIHHS